MTGLHVGQQLYVVLQSAAFAVQVRRVGRKYAYACSYTSEYEYVISLANMAVTDRRSNVIGYAWLSAAAYMGHAARQQAWQELCDYLSHRCSPPDHLTSQQNTDIQRQIIG